MDDILEITPLNLAQISTFEWVEIMPGVLAPKPQPTPQTQPQTGEFE